LDIDSSYRLWLATTGNPSAAAILTATEFLQDLVDSGTFERAIEAGIRGAFADDSPLDLLETLRSQAGGKA